MSVAVVSDSLVTEFASRITFSPKVGFHPGWNKISGLSVVDGQLTIDPMRYFVRCEDPSWTYVPWELVRTCWSEIKETSEQALEQSALQFIAKHKHVTRDPLVVLTNAEAVYSYVFDRERLAMYDDLRDVSTADLRILRESSILCALNKVDLTGRITVIGPAWYFAQCARTVFELDQIDESRVDELFHGNFFNAARLRDQVRAHVALGGKLVHGCQGTGNGAGGCVVGYGTDVQRMQSELVALREPIVRAFEAHARR